MKLGNIGRSMRASSRSAPCLVFPVLRMCLKRRQFIVTYAGVDAENLGAEPSDAAVFADMLSEDMETGEMVDSAVGDAGEDQVHAGAKRQYGR